MIGTSGAPLAASPRQLLGLAVYPARRWRLLAVVLACHVASIAVAALAPWPMKILLDNVLRHHPLRGALATVAPAAPRALLAWTVTATFVLFLLRWLVGLASSYSGTLLSQTLTYDVGGDLLDSLLRMSLRFHRRRGVGDAIRRITVDSTCVSSLVTGLVVPLVSAVVSLATVFGVLWRLDDALLPYALVAVPLMAWALLRYRRPMAEASVAEQSTDGDVYNQLEQSLTGIAVIQAFQGEERAERAFSARTERALGATVAATSVQLRFKVAAAASTAVATSVIFWVGAHQAMSGRITLGGITVFLAYLQSLYAPLHAVTHTGATLQGLSGMARRLLEVLSAEPEVVDRPGAHRLPAVRGHVVMRDVVFGYDDDHPVLRGVSLEARPGQTVAVVGPSGAGKTTLVSLVARFFDPWSGQVLLDGHDVRDVALADLRRQVSVVLQDSFLFPLSIADNIAYGRPDATRDEIEAAARAANAHDFVMKLPGGYDTVVGERGATLSGGERQRIAIARALLKDAPVLILDEPTSALDPESEHLLLEALDRLMAGRTTLIIAHRLSTVRHADRIVVLEDGRVVEAGSHRELMALAARYAGMQDLQRRTRRRSRSQAGRAEAGQAGDGGDQPLVASVGNRAERSSGKRPTARRL